MAERWKCKECEEMLPRDRFYWDNRGRRKSTCKACRKTYAGHERAKQREADFVSHLERLRRLGCRLEPWQLAELFGGPTAAHLARRLGYSDVIESAWEWEDGNIKAAGPAGNPYAVIGSWDRRSK